MHTVAVTITTVVWILPFCEMPASAHLARIYLQWRAQE